MPTTTTPQVRAGTYENTETEVKFEVEPDGDQVIMRRLGVEVRRELSKFQFDLTIGTYTFLYE